ncbi:MAG: bifunctional DNA-formamidopyrimidine glycosylase/DNA-(apurinic or apyrimidinic site) lyase [Candidatus Moranbacteria bacterium]|nr:bifunctional DNA-formamidopyrimidine glycosylase/DNA-(apurinic or apyrimidinic site) lyase [Candidatus Moranbacteria bacterium]
MPELPEVQTVVNDLNEKIKGDTITDFWSEWPKAIKGKTLAVFKKEIVGRKILGVRRIGKNIFVDLSGEKTLYLHLKMTGHLLIKSKVQSRKSKVDGKDYFEDRVNQYIRHKFYLKSEIRKSKSETISKTETQNTKDKKNIKFNKVIEFSDVRKFAKIVLVDTDKVLELPEIKALGIDAVSPDFTFKKFNEILDRKAKSPIGIILMDQNLIAGIGNIYRSEILFVAGILPTRLAGNISTIERKKLFGWIGKILRHAIKLRGTSDSDYRDTSGAPGGFQKVLKVYRKAGEKCQKCDTIIVRETIGQRSVFFCPKCQK